MSSRIEDLFCHYTDPEKKVRRVDLVTEINEAYAGHLEAQAVMYRCKEDSLDKALGGASHFITIAEGCYDYAVEGQLQATGTDLNHDSWLDFAAFINQARWDAEFYQANSLSPNLEHVFKLGAIRARLDCDTLGEVAYEALPEVLRDAAVGYLSLHEIAFLARMTEKAVRNATQPTAANRLVTRKEGTRTVVDSHEALRWLKGRRNFYQTELV